MTQRQPALTRVLQRGELKALHESITQLVIAAEKIEDVDVAIAI